MFLLEIKHIIFLQFNIAQKVANFCMHNKCWGYMEIK